MVDIDQTMKAFAEGEFDGHLGELFEALFARAVGPRGAANLAKR